MSVGGPYSSIRRAPPNRAPPNHCAALHLHAERLPSWVNIIPRFCALHSATAPNAFHHDESHRSNDPVFLPYCINADLPDDTHACLGRVWSHEL